MPNSILPQDQDGQELFNAIFSFQDLIKLTSEQQELLLWHLKNRICISSGTF